MKTVHDKGREAAMAAAAKWNEDFTAWVDRQGDIGTFVEKPVEMTQPKWIAIGTKENADLVTRNTTSSGLPWRVTRFMRYMGAEVPPEWFAANRWEPWGHIEYGSKRAAFLEAWQYGGKRYTTKQLFARLRDTGTGDLFAQPTAAAPPVEDQFVMTEQSKSHGDVPVTVNIAKFDAVFAQEPDFYIGPGGKGQIEPRYENFGEWVKKGLPIEMPVVSTNWKRGYRIHQWPPSLAWLRDHGRRTIQLVVPANQAAEFRERFGPTAPRTIATTGEGQLFTEEELPFNLQGEIDTTPERQAAADAARAERERQAEAARTQRQLFAGPREFADIPLSVQDGMAGATPQEAQQFRANVGNAIRVADEFGMRDARDEAQVALAQAIRDHQPVENVVRNHLRRLLAHPTYLEPEEAVGVEARAQAMSDEAEASATAMARDIEEASVPAERRVKVADVTTRICAAVSTR